MWYRFSTANSLATKQKMLNCIAPSFLDKRHTPYFKLIKPPPPLSLKLNWDLIPRDQFNSNIQYNPYDFELGPIVPNLTP